MCGLQRAWKRWWEDIMHTKMFGLLQSKNNLGCVHSGCVERRSYCWSRPMKDFRSAACSMFLCRDIICIRFTLPLNFHLVFCLPWSNAALLDSKAQLFGKSWNSCCVAIQGCVLRYFSLLLACYLSVRSSRRYQRCVPILRVHLLVHITNDIGTLMVAHRGFFGCGTTIADHETELTHETHENFYPTWQNGEKKFASCG